MKLNEQNSQCKKCRSELIRIRVYNRPDWWWCHCCDAVYDENGVYKGTLEELESRNHETRMGVQSKSMKR